MAPDDHCNTLTWDAKNPKAVLMLIHGVAEHGARYHSIGEYLSQRGYTTTTFDLPGHGRSDGIPGHIDHFSDYLEASLAFYKSVKIRYPDLPVFLIGHSMGGLIAAQLLLEHQELFSGALLSGPAIEVPNVPPTWQVAIIKLLAAVAPKLKLLKIDASGISQDPAVIEKYLNDPLVYTGKLSARYLLEMSNAMDNCKTHAKKVEIPIIIMHGASDSITKPSGSKFLYQHISSIDKTLNIYPDLYHEIFNEPQAEIIYADICDWLDAH